jgi:hypothetical protein
LVRLHHDLGAAMRAERSQRSPTFSPLASDCQLGSLMSERATTQIALVGWGGQIFIGAVWQCEVPDGMVGPRRRGRTPGSEKPQFLVKVSPNIADRLAQRKHHRYLRSGSCGRSRDRRGPFFLPIHWVVNSSVHRDRVLGHGTPGIRHAVRSESRPGDTFPQTVRPSMSIYLLKDIGPLRTGGARTPTA